MRMEIPGGPAGGRVRLRGMVVRCAGVGPWADDAVVRRVPPFRLFGRCSEVVCCLTAERWRLFLQRRGEHADVVAAVPQSWRSNRERGSELLCMCPEVSLRRPSRMSDGRDQCLRIYHRRSPRRDALRLLLFVRCVDQLLVLAAEVLCWRSAYRDVLLAVSPQDGHVRL